VGGKLFSGTFVKTFVGARFHSFNSRTFIRAIGQYRHTAYDSAVYTALVDGESRGLLSQLLFSCKVNSQTVLFLGYAENRRGMVDPERNEWPLTTMDRTVFAKVGYAWRP